MANFYKKAQSARRAQQKKAQSGRSMVEMLGVLAIIGVLSIGGIAGYTKAMEAYKINKLRDQVVTIFQNITFAVANGQSTSQFADANVVDTLQILPPEMGTARNCHHALGGYCALNTTTIADGSYYNVLLRLKDLPPAACIAISTLEFSLSGQYVGTYINSANSVNVDSTTCTKEDGTKSCLIAAHRTIAEAARECNGKLNAVMIKFGNKV